MPEKYVTSTWAPASAAAAIVQQAVDGVRGLERVELGAGHARALGRPDGLVVVQDRDPRLDMAAHELAEPAGDAAELLDLPGAGAVGAGVRHDGAVELLRPGPRLSPLEPADGVGAPGHVRERVADGLAEVL